MIVDTLMKSAHIFPYVYDASSAKYSYSLYQQDIETSRHSKIIISDKGIGVCKMTLDEFSKRAWEHH
jgi:hypothetical protein